MKEIKEKKLVQTEQTVYKYISDDGKFSSEFSYDVEKYEQKQQEPYIKEYKTRLSELHKWVTENKEYLYTGKDYAGTLDENDLKIKIIIYRQGSIKPELKSFEKV